MRIGISTAAFYGRLETEDAASHLASLGVPCCEVFFETYSEYTRAFGELVRSRLGGTQAVSIHCKTQHFESDIMGQSARQREDAYGMMSTFLDAGHALGAGVYVYHGPASVRGAKPPSYERWREAIDRAIALSASRKIDFSWETVTWCHLNSPERVAQFRRIWPDLHFVLDIKQVLLLGHDPIAYIDAMGERLRHVHILDVDAKGRYALPGAGPHDFCDFARALRQSGYAGDVILEPYASVVTSEQALIDSVAWLRGTFQAS
ncbi:sugar phosphate isomerase/epimerase [Eubacteriales bacterium OttesenSCG-928-A19]|nr:sugar phosphate isomerase/epimerase [Eubacteriales bacterium OttesenSCG-928-A19]